MLPFPALSRRQSFSYQDLLLFFRFKFHGWNFNFGLANFFFQARIEGFSSKVRESKLSRLNFKEDFVFKG